MEALARAALPRPYSLTLPEGSKGAFAATFTPDRVENIRVVYVDQYDARVLDDVGYARFGPAAKAIEWGIAVHQGQQYGSVNRYVMLAGCNAIVLLSITSVTMWWKRRPRGALGVPPRPDRPQAGRAILAMVLPLALLFPLVGASLLAAVAIDLGARWVLRAKRAV
jgi:uncharacterized iron-regulated membrane protein